MLAWLPGLPRQPLNYHLRWQWFAPVAEVEPGLGGKVTVGWGPGMEGTAPITGREPGSRFAWTQDHGPGGKRVMEFTLEAQGGKTKLRLVHSGFGTEASFDNEFDSTLGGWLTFLACLRYYLATMRSASGRHEARITMSQGDPGELWVRLTSGMGLSGQNLSAGTPYRATLPDGKSFSGIVVASAKARYAVVTRRRNGRKSACVVLESFGGGCAFTASWYLYGAGLADNSPLLAGWNQYYDSLTSTEGAAA
jgi:hypothetical protein